MGRFGSISDMAAAALHVRVWCMRCARGRELVAADVPPAFAALPLVAIAARMRCRSCRRTDAILIIPASPPRSPRRIVEEIPYDPDYTSTRAVVAFFHLMRSQRKKPREPLDPLKESIRQSTRAEEARQREMIERMLIDGQPVRGRWIDMHTRPSAD